MFELRGLVALVPRRIDGVDYMALGKALGDCGLSALYGYAANIESILRN